MSSNDQPKTIREAIKLGVENDIAKAKYFQDKSEERQLEKIEIKYQKEMISKQFFADERKPEYGEEMRVAKYVDTALGDIKSFFKGIIGDDYEPKNNFSFSQKQKILNYLYFRNKADMESPLKYKSAYGGIEEQDMYIYTLENRIQGINKLKFDNRVLYINQVAQCQNRIRFNGFFWGIFASSICWGTFMRKQSIIRKVCLTLILMHIGGQIASYRSIDRVFDSLYPIFLKDYDQFFIDEENRKKEHAEAGGIKKDEIQIMIEENMKQIRKGKKLAQLKEEEYFD
ncbi:hypothetical protein ABPG72_022703 [Tetrahymena utriculariae]